MVSTSITRLLPRPVLPALWRELGGAGRGAFGAGGVPAPPAATGRVPVLLIPGLLAGDGSMDAIAQALRAAGHHPHAAGTRRNVGCSERVVGRLEAIADRLADQHGRPLALVGHSRGGPFARVLARRRPELVAGVITLGTPYRDPLAIHPLVWASAAALATAGTLRIPGLMSWSCGASRCCGSFDRDLAAPLPDDIALLSIYTRRDGVVDWRACVDPARTPARSRVDALRHDGARPDAVGADRGADEPPPPRARPRGPHGRPLVDAGGRRPELTRVGRPPGRNTSLGRPKIRTYTDVAVSNRP
jgi:triacylglycerol lipase